MMRRVASAANREEMGATLPWPTILARELEPGFIPGKGADALASFRIAACTRCMLV